MKDLLFLNCDKLDFHQKTPKRLSNETSSKHETRLSLKRRDIVTNYLIVNELQPQLQGAVIQQIIIPSPLTRLLD